MVGMVHGISHALGGVYHVPHGLANSILLPYAMMYNMDESADRYAMIARTMDLDVKGLSDDAAGQAAVNAIWELTQKMGERLDCCTTK